MENFEIKNFVPRWYKVILSLWAPLSLLAGGVVAYYIVDRPPSMTVLISSVANAIQVILLGMLITYGLRYCTARQLAKRLVIPFFFIIVALIVLLVIGTEGEVPIGALALMALVTISIPQLIYAGLYGVARKILKSSYSVLVVSALAHIILFSFLFQFLGE